MNWVESNFSEDPGHFQSTTTLYKAYCEEIPQDQIVTETAFVQQIENIMSALKLNPGKSRFNKVRGYVGTTLFSRRKNEDEVLKQNSEAC